MKKTQKGLTLVEVLVSIAVFTIISLVMFSSLLAMTKVVALQEDYARIEMACRDMNAYWDMYGDHDKSAEEDTDWYKKYFSSEANFGEGYLKYQGGQLVPTNDNNSDFKVIYEYTDDNKLIIKSIYSTSKNRNYLPDNGIDCGESKGGT